MEIRRIEQKAFEFVTEIQPNILYVYPCYEEV